MTPTKVLSRSRDRPLTWASPPTRVTGIAGSSIDSVAFSLRNGLSTERVASGRDASVKGRRDGAARVVARVASVDASAVLGSAGADALGNRGGAIGRTRLGLGLRKALAAARVGVAAAGGDGRVDRAARAFARAREHPLRADRARCLYIVDSVARVLGCRRISTAGATAGGSDT
jgi:hypothetical protein